ncbi:MAG: S8 family serine peptidase [Candidatus Pacearchaeota archaeon]|jgi:subtilisin family serine protease
MFKKKRDRIILIIVLLVLLVLINYLPKKSINGNFLFVSKYYSSPVKFDPDINNRFNNDLNQLSIKSNKENNYDRYLKNRNSYTISDFLGENNKIKREEVYGISSEEENIVYQDSEKKIKESYSWTDNKKIRKLSVVDYDESEIYKEEYLANEFIIKSELSFEEIDKITKASGLEILRRIKIDEEFHLYKIKHPTKELEEVIIDPNLDILFNNGFIEPNFLLSVEEIPNDSSLNLLWAFNNIGQTGGKNDSDIDMFEAWDLSKGSNEIIVAVIDSGVDYNHPDLKNNIWINLDEIANNSIDDDLNGYIDDVVGWDFYNYDKDPNDEHSHGSHISGTIAAVYNNSIGVAGIAPNVKIMPLRFLGPDNYGSMFDALEALKYAINKGVKITSNSYSGVMSNQFKLSKDNDTFFIWSAGNNGANLDLDSFYTIYRFNYSNIIIVASTDHLDNRPSWSNYGSKGVDLAAPGANIYSTWKLGGYGSKSGTSMSAPHVSGVVALLASLRPDWNNSRIKSALLNGTDYVESYFNKSITQGRLNAYNSLKIADSYDPIVVIKNDNIKILDESKFNFGKTIENVPIVESFTIINYAIHDNSTDLQINNLSVPAGYSVLTMPDKNLLKKGESTTFIVKLNSLISGNYTGVISINTNNPEINNYNILVTGIVEKEKNITIIDDLEESFYNYFDWYTVANTNSYNGSYHIKYPQMDYFQLNNFAKWSFINNPGNFSIYTTWSNESYYKQNVSYVIYDNEIEVGRVFIDQSKPAKDLTYLNLKWGFLGNYSFNSNNIIVKVLQEGNYYIPADAMMVIKSGTLTKENNPPILNPIGNKSAKEGDFIVFVVSGYDIDNDNTTLSAINIPNGASFNPNSGLFNYQPAIGHAGIYRINFTISDGKLIDYETIILNISSFGNINNCNLTNAYFLNSSVIEGILTNMIVRGSDCNNESIEFFLRRKDNHQLVKSINSTLYQNNASVSWTSIYNATDYYFIARLIKNNSIWINSTKYQFGILNVLKNEFCIDNDKDGFGTCPNNCNKNKSCSYDGNDCNDSNILVNPGITEGWINNKTNTNFSSSWQMCGDNIDNDCDNIIDCDEISCSGSPNCKKCFNNTNELPICIQSSCINNETVYSFNNSLCDDKDPCTRDGCKINGCTNIFESNNQSCLEKIKNCTDIDNDSILDYNPISCLSGKDFCIINYSNFINKTSLYPRAINYNLYWRNNSEVNNILDLRISKNGIIEINFSDFINLLEINGSGCYNSIILDPLINIKDKYAFIDSENIPNLKKPARIIFKNINLNNPKILKNGLDCLDCSIIRYDTSLNNLEVSINGFSSYEVVENVSLPNSPIYTPEQTFAGSSGGGGGSSGGIILNKKDNNSDKNKTIINDTKENNINKSEGNEINEEKIIEENPVKNQNSLENNNLIFLFILGIILLLIFIIIFIILIRKKLKMRFLN